MPKLLNISMTFNIRTIRWWHLVCASNDRRNWTIGYSTIRSCGRMTRGVLHRHWLFNSCYILNDIIEIMISISFIFQLRPYLCPWCIFKCYPILIFILGLTHILLNIAWVLKLMHILHLIHILLYISCINIQLIVQLNCSPLT